LLDGIGNYESAMTEIADARKRGLDVRTETVISGPQEPADPSSYLREVLRVPKEGETQVQGTLMKIECDPKKGIVFVVQTATGLLRLGTKTFDDIEITTYDPKVAGEITCGPRKPESVVVVCYVPATKTLKSVEFVPADFKLK